MNLLRLVVENESNITDFDKSYAIGEHQLGILYAQVRNKEYGIWSIRVVIGPRDGCHEKWKMVCWLNEIDNLNLSKEAITFETKEEADKKLNDLANTYGWYGFL